MCKCGHNCSNCQRKGEESDIPRILSAEDEKIREEYYRSQGLRSVDIGSRQALIKEIKRLAADYGYSVSGYSKMPIRQLKAIYHTLNNK